MVLLDHVAGVREQTLDLRLEYVVENIGEGWRERGKMPGIKPV